MIKNFRRIIDNIYAGSAPEVEDLAKLQKMGIKYILSLDLSSANKIKTYLKSLNIKHIIIPLETSNTINDNLKYLIRNIQRILTGYQPIYIHCLHGSDRTGLAIAAYKVLKYNYPAKQAINEVRKYGYGLGISQQTQKLWNDLLFTLEKDGQVVDDNFVLDNDVTSLLHDIFRINDITPAYTSMPSFAPKADIPILSVDPAVQIIQDNLVNIKIPQMGQYSSLGPARGGGAIEVQDPTTNII
jgi:protein-tyrosine phosphatase